jgi:hypothetical protein
MEKKSNVDEADPPESGETKGDEISTENSYHQVAVRNGIFEVSDFPPSSFLNSPIDFFQVLTHPISGSD